jgi:glycosyltransferase involved in cell wall biosynthesis
MRRLQRVLAALEKECWPREYREIIIVDNRSSPPLAGMQFGRGDDLPRVVREERLGLTFARIRGIREARGDVIIFVDDDNLLAPNYLRVVAECFDADPALGAVGGKSLPEFQTPPPAWTREFWDVLAIRDLGDESLRAGRGNEYPKCAPIGAGMAVRTDAAAKWAEVAERDAARLALDRTGRALSSGGDNDLILQVLQQNVDVAYIPQLKLIHVIPPARLTRRYLARLSYASSRSWVQVLRLHRMSPWKRLSRFGAAIRKVRSYFLMAAWRGDVEYLRWRGACGIFDGRKG